MSLLKLLKKWGRKFNFELLEHIIIFNFKDILLLIVLFFIIVIVIIVFILSGQSSNLGNNIKKVVEMKEIEEVKELEKSKITKEKFNYSKDILLTVDDFMIPDIKTFDLTFDYIEILPNKYYTIPRIELLKKDYEAFFNTISEEALKFDFEKRDEKKFKFKSK